MPKPSAGAEAVLRSILPEDGDFTIKKVFGHPAAFVNGNMCIGTFGPDVFLRLDRVDFERASRIPGARPFDPMAGRPMKGYLVLPTTFLKDASKSHEWIARSVRFASSLPAKKAKKRP